MVLSLLLSTLVVVDLVRHSRCSPLFFVSFCSPKTRAKVSNVDDDGVVRQKKVVVINTLVGG